MFDHDSDPIPIPLAELLIYEGDELIFDGSDPSTYGVAPSSARNPPLQRVRRDVLWSRAVSTVNHARCEATALFPGACGARGVPLLGKSSWQSEVGEEAALAEPRDRRDALVAESEHH
jgi:hypothetical protein